MTVPYALSKELSKRGHEVTILTTDSEFDRAYADNIKNCGVNVVVSHCTSNIGQFLISPEMKKWARDTIESYEIVHLNNFRSYQNNVIYKYAMKRGVPFIMQAHGSVLPFFERRTLKSIYDILWGNNLLKDACRLLAVSQTEAEQYRMMGASLDKISIIYNPIETNIIMPLPSVKKTIKKRFEIDENSRIILYLGRIHKRKGIDFLIRVFNELIKEMDDVILLIIGPDDEHSYRSELKSLAKRLGIAEKIKFIDYIENTSEAYSIADILVYPAVHEIFGIVPFEAIMHGVPVIVTDDCGCGEIIENANSGLLVRYGDILEMSSKIIFILKNASESKKMVENGQAFIKNNLSCEKIVNRLERVYENCIY